MADITPARVNISQQAVQYRSAVSESILGAVGGSINFINNFQYTDKTFYANGLYNITGVNETAVDGLYVIPPGINIQIIGAAMFNIVAGSGGTTTLDVKAATVSGGPFISIFATPPAIATSAGANAFISTGGSGTGLTAPVLGNTPLNISAGAALRLDFLGKQTGAPQNCGLILFFQPR